MNWQRYWRRNKQEIIRWGIVVVSAIVVAFLAIFLADILDRDYTFYNPRDESRGHIIPLFEPKDHPPIYTFEDEHKQALERG